MLERTELQFRKMNASKNINYELKNHKNVNLNLMRN